MQVALSSRPLFRKRKCRDAALSNAGVALRHESHIKYFRRSRAIRDDRSVQLLAGDGVGNRTVGAFEEPIGPRTAGQRAGVRVVVNDRAED